MGEIVLFVSASLLGLIFGSFLTVCIYRIPFRSLGVGEEIADAEDASARDAATYSASDAITGPSASSAANDVSAERRLDTIGDEEQPLPELPEGVCDPRRLSIAFPRRSFCTSCGHQLRWWNNIPLVSWLLQSGRCAYCREHIPMRYPLVELASAFCAFSCMFQFGPTLTGLLLYLYCCALIVITVIDYDFYIIPNVITFPGIAIGFGLAAINQYSAIFAPPFSENLMDSVWGIAAGAGFLYVIAEFYLRVRRIEGLGLGDVKLLAMVGAWFGLGCAVFTIFVGSLIGALGGFLLILFRGHKMTQPVPFGPFLAIANLIYILAGGDALFRWGIAFRSMMLGVTRQAF